MYNAIKNHKKSAERLESIYTDLEPHTSVDLEWHKPIAALGTLGNAAQIELWLFAQYFLLEWHDWHGLSKRYQQYFYGSHRNLPNSLNELGAKCASLASKLLRDAALADLVAAHWRSLSWANGNSGTVASAVENFYHALVQSHRHWLLIHDAADDRIWNLCLTETRRRDLELLDSWHRLQRTIQDQILFHLRHYCCASLLMSWLLRGPIQDYPGSSALIKIAKQAAGVGRSVIAPFLDSVSSRSHQDVRPALERLVDAIGEIGFDAFVDDVTSDEYCGGPASPVDTSKITLGLRPVGENGHSVLLVILSGSKSTIRSRADKALKQLGNLPTIRDFVIISNNWIPEILDQHRLQFARFINAGGHIHYLLVGTSDRLLSPVAVNLGIDAANKHFD